eukprot:4005092-Pleurochrysis_carterae.AAC.2
MAVGFQIRCEMERGIMYADKFGMRESIVEVILRSHLRGAQTSCRPCVPLLVAANDNESANVRAELAQIRSSQLSSTRVRCLRFTFRRIPSVRMNHVSSDAKRRAIYEHQSARRLHELNVRCGCHREF